MAVSQFVFLIVCLVGAYAGSSSEIYKPAEIFNKDEFRDYAILVMNRPIALSPKIMVPLWNNAAIRIAIDEGTDFWLDYLKLHNLLDEVKPIEYLTGNFLSISEEGRDYAQSNGAIIMETPNESETDFTKALKGLATHMQNNKMNINRFVVVHQTSGRPDHLYANTNTLMMEEIQNLYAGKQIFLLSDESLTWLVKSGKTIINVPSALQDKKRVWCSLVPVGQKCEDVTTTGLRWNLTGQSMEFGGLISTSNEFNCGSRIVAIETSSPLVWSMDISPIVSNSVVKHKCH